MKIEAALKSDDAFVTEESGQWFDITWDDPEFEALLQFAEMSVKRITRSARHNFEAGVNVPL